MKLEELESLMLKEIKSQPERKLLLEAEQEIFNDKEAMDLIALFNEAQEEYNFVLRIFPSDENKKKEKQKELYIAKKNMDDNEKVKRYNDLLIKCNEPLRYLEYKLIDKEMNYCEFNN